MKAIMGIAAAAAGVVVLLLIPVMVLVLMSSASTPAAGSSAVGNLDPGKVPAEYRPMVEKAGQECPQIPAAAIAAQLQQESQWNPTAQSPAGAGGIAQFMPGTWPSYGRDADGNGRSSPLDPADAIAAQGRFMCELAETVAPIAERTGRPVLDLAWAAYNAGPGAVQEYGGIPPYTETQHYVKILRETMSDFVDPKSVSGSGSGKASGGWAAPLDTLTPTSGFGPRGSPCAGCSNNHQGQDFGGATGTPIYAACDGTVDFAGTMSGYGNITFINCGGGIRTGYAHQSEIGVTAGQQVKAGDTIGKVGNTGVGTGSHLHFEVRTNAPAGGGGLSGTPVDPAGFMSAKGVTW